MSEKKFSKEAVQYQMKPKDKKSLDVCKNCRFYQGRFECDIVKGMVSPLGTCTAFKQK